MADVRSWRVYHGEVFLGMATLTEADFPWFHCHFAATAAFAPYRALFMRELHAIRNNDDDGWEDTRAEIDALALRFEALHATDGIHEAGLLHIEENQMWFRPWFAEDQPEEAQ
jgi:hypothetical protein